MEYSKDNKILDLPNQKVSSKKKQSPKWQRDCVDYFTSNITNQASSGTRKSVSEMDANIRLIGGVPNAEDLRASFDPLGMTGVEENFENGPLKSQFYNIINNPLKTLYGEELKRRSDIRAIVVNQFAINAKDEEFEGKVMEFFQNEAQELAANEEDLQSRLQELDRFSKYDLQSAHEKMANEIIQVLSNNRDLNIKRLFNDGFKSLNTIGEEVYRVGGIGNEPWVFKVDSRNFR